MLLESKRTDEVADLLRALGHPLRLRIAALLNDGPMNVGGIASRLGAQQAIVSQQLRILRMSGVVAATRTRGQALYRLTRPEVGQLLHCMQMHSLNCEAL